jgi:putative flippase GtrA
MRNYFQLFKFTLVGLLSNIFLYFTYLKITSIGISPKTSMTFLYFTGMILTFYFNRSWTFKHKTKDAPALIRFVKLYSIGYFINLILLLVLVDRFGWSHQRAQGIAVFVIAIFLFFGQKIWVFKLPASRRRS